ncbi:MAG: head GIN domain-containing protein [Bacteroidales bacterium]
MRKGWRQDKRDGPIVSQNFELPTITGIALSIDAEVILTEGDSQEVRIEAQQNIINNIEKYVSNGIWGIDFYNNVGSHSSIRIFITSKMLDYASISGSGFIHTDNMFTDTTNLYLKISGSGSISVHTIADLIESDISGSGQIMASGQANEHRIYISGSGNVRAFGLETENTSVDISGSGNSEVFVKNYLDVKISGSGSVYYKGNPQINVNISGSGGVIDSN